MEGSNSTWNFDKNEKIYSVIFKLPNYVSRVRNLEIAPGWVFFSTGFEIFYAKFRDLEKFLIWFFIKKISIGCVRINTKFRNLVFPEISSLIVSEKFLILNFIKASTTDIVPSLSSNELKLNFLNENVFENECKFDLSQNGNSLSKRLIFWSSRNSDLEADVSLDSKRNLKNRGSISLRLSNDKIFKLSSDKVSKKLPP